MSGQVDLNVMLTGEEANAVALVVCWDMDHQAQEIGSHQPISALPGHMIQWMYFHRRIRDFGGIAEQLSWRAHHSEPQTISATESVMLNVMVCLQEHAADYDTADPDGPGFAEGCDSAARAIAGVYAKADRQVAEAAASPEADADA